MGILILFLNLKEKLLTFTTEHDVSCEFVNIQPVLYEDTDLRYLILESFYPINDVKFGQMLFQHLQK